MICGGITQICLMPILFIWSFVQSVQFWKVGCKEKHKFKREGETSPIDSDIEADKPPPSTAPTAAYQVAVTNGPPPTYLYQGQNPQALVIAEAQPGQMVNIQPQGGGLPQTVTLHPAPMVQQAPVQQQAPMYLVQGQQQQPMMVQQQHVQPVYGTAPHHYN
eukprot:Trichotokara_eunicae@DN6359_c0_g2_i11.p1